MDAPERKTGLWCLWALESLAILVWAHAAREWIQGLTEIYHQNGLTLGGRGLPLPSRFALYAGPVICGVFALAMTIAGAWVVAKKEPHRALVTLLCLGAAYLCLLG